MLKGNGTQGVSNIKVRLSDDAQIGLTDS
ncbi:MAG: hypothetical protein RL003_694, partial [Bacteroidota bacterium]